MLTLEDDTMLADFAKAEAKDPSPRKQVDQSRTIYRSRRFRRPLKGNNYGLPILCDFGEARIGRTQESGPFVQPHIYRAPEIIFEMPWGSAVDIWNVACLVTKTIAALFPWSCIRRLRLNRFGTSLKASTCLETSSIPKAPTTLSNT